MTTRRSKAQQGRGQRRSPVPETAKPAGPFAAPPAPAPVPEVQTEVPLPDAVRPQGSRAPVAGTELSGHDFNLDAARAAGQKAEQIAAADPPGPKDRQPPEEIRAQIEAEGPRGMADPLAGKSPHERNMIESAARGVAAAEKAEDATVAAPAKAKPKTTIGQIVLFTSALRKGGLRGAGTTAAIVTRNDPVTGFPSLTVFGYRSTSYAEAVTDDKSAGEYWEPLPN